MPRKVSKAPPCVQVIQGKNCRYLMFWCGMCKQTHTVAVRERKEIVKGFSKYDSNRAIWQWNGSVTYPVLDHCVVSRVTLRSGRKRVCHRFLSGHRLTPVSKWGLKPKGCKARPKRTVKKLKRKLTKVQRLHRQLDRFPQPTFYYSQWRYAR